MKPLLTIQKGLHKASVQRGFYTERASQSLGVCIYSVYRDFAKPFGLVHTCNFILLQIWRG